VSSGDGGIVKADVLRLFVAVQQLVDLCEICTIGQRIYLQ